MIAKGNQNIFDFTLQEFGTLENLFDDVLVPNSLNADSEIKQDQEININALGKGNDDVKMKISEQGLSMTNGEIGKTIIIDKILIAITPTNLFTVGINLTFASGIITIDWKDGSAIENFVSEVELTHEYAIAGTYIAEITGDFINITQFIADSSRITSISNLTTGLLSTLLFQTNLLDGILDLSNAPIKSTFSAKENPDLERVIFALSGNEIIFNLQLFSCNITGIMDMSSVPIGGTSSFFYSHLNPLMTNVLFSAAGNLAVNAFRLDGCGLTGTLNLINVPINPTIAFYAYSNPLLTDIAFSLSGNGTLSNMRIYSCNLNYIDFTTFNFNANNCLLMVQNNLMGVADVNHILVDLFSLVSSEGVGGDFTGRSINIGGTNDAPDGSSGGYDGITARTNLQGKGFTVTI